MVDEKCCDAPTPNAEAKENTSVTKKGAAPQAVANDRSWLKRSDEPAHGMVHVGESAVKKLGKLLETRRQLYGLNGPAPKSKTSAAATRVATTATVDIRLSIE